MKGNSFIGPVRLKVDFGNVTIDNIANASIELSYADLTLDNAGDIRFESRSSEIYLNEIEKIYIDSRRDKYYVKSAGEVSGEAFFSYLNLDKVRTKINLKTNYGEIKLLAMTDKFTGMDLSVQYTDINLYLDDDHLYEFVITRDDRSQVIASADLLTKKEVVVPELEKTFRSTITAGRTDRPKVPVTINIKSGKIYLL
jgi:hypothetical protein